MKYEVEKVSDGVWIHTKHPDTGERVSVYVNVCGSPDGLIVDFWRGDVGVHSIGLEWADFEDEE